MDHSPQDPHPLDYQATIDRMEPGIAPVEPQIALASIAISMVTLNRQLNAVIQRLDDVRYAINQVSNNGQNIVPAISSLGSNVAGFHHMVTQNLKVLNEHIAKTGGTPPAVG